MSSQEMNELHEHAARAENNPHLAPVTLTMAVLAVVVAAVSILGHRAHTNEVLLQNEMSDGWAHYQAKAIRLNTDQMFVYLVSVVSSTDPVQAAKLRDQYQKEVERYKNDNRDLDGTARQLESKVGIERHKTYFYDLGEVLVEIALVITSITLLSGRRGFWYAGMLIGAIGTVIVATGSIIH